MKKAIDILAECQRKAVIITKDGGDLDCRGHKGSLTPDLIRELKKHKPALLSVLGVQALLKDVGLGETIVGDVEAFLDSLDSREADRRRIYCVYTGQLRLVHPEVCQWHRSENDPECRDCKPLHTMNSRILECKVIFTSKMLTHEWVCAHVIDPLEDGA